MLHLQHKLLSATDSGKLVYTDLEQMPQSYKRLIQVTETKPTNRFLTDWLNLSNNRWTKNRPIWLTIGGWKPTNDWWQTLHFQLTPSWLFILTNHVQKTILILSSTDKHYSLDSEDDFCSGYPHPGQSHYMNYWYSWVQSSYLIYSNI